MAPVSVDPTAAELGPEIRPLRGSRAGTKPWGTRGPPSGGGIGSRDVPWAGASSRSQLEPNSRGNGVTSAPLLRAFSSFGRAPSLQGGGGRFEPGKVHVVLLEALESGVAEPWRQVAH